MAPRHTSLAAEEAMPGAVTARPAARVVLRPLATPLPLGFLAAAMGLLTRDLVAATGMGILLGTWPRHA